MNTSTAVAGLALSILAAIPCARAQVATAEAWGNDNCLYTANNRAWVPTQICRRFPIARNPNVWDLFDANRVPLYRFDLSAPGVIQLYHYPSGRGTRVVNRGSVVDAMTQHLQQLKTLLAQHQQAQNAVPSQGNFVLGGPAYVGTGSVVLGLPPSGKRSRTMEFLSALQAQ